MCRAEGPEGFGEGSENDGKHPNPSSRMVVLTRQTGQNGFLRGQSYALDSFCLTRRLLILYNALAQYRGDFLSLFR